MKDTLIINLQTDAFLVIVAKRLNLIAIQFDHLLLQLEMDVIVLSAINIKISY